MAAAPVSEAANAADFKKCENTTCKREFVTTALYRGDQNPSLSTNKLCTDVLSENTITHDSPPAVILNVTNCFNGDGTPVKKVNIENESSQTTCIQDERSHIFQCVSRAR